MQAKIIRTFLAVFLLLISFNINISSALAVNITNAYDTIETVQPSVFLVPHQLTFTEPIGSFIAATDYISIQMPYYSSIDISNLTVSGSFVYGDNTGLHVSITGTTIQLSNISVVGGNTISINEFRAKNPSSPDQFGEKLIISTDAEMQNVKNLATIDPTEFNGRIASTATVKPYTAEITLQGYSYPLTFISVTEGNSVLGTTAPDGTGFFQVQLTGLPPGIHNLNVYGIDGSNNTTAVSTFSLYAAPYQVTVYQNIVLSPIVTLSSANINQGDTLTINGETVPNSSVTISINSPLLQLSTNADANGNFSYQFNQTTNMSPGQYSVNALAQLPSSLQSPDSLSQTFTVLSTNSQQNPQQPSCDISKGDLNCDGKVDLVDLSILLYYWGSNNPLGDVNGDGVVNLVDFSIMMFYWTG